MRVEDSRLRTRLRRPLLIMAGVALVLVLPAWLWIARGRKVPLEVVLDPPRYVVKTGTRLPLRPRIRPTGEDLTISWSGSGVHPDRDGRQASWRAPDVPGVVRVSVTVRRAGTKVTDAVSFQVVAREPEALPLSGRPTAPIPPPAGLPACGPDRGAAPTVQVHGRACIGAQLVAEAVGAPGGRVWHWWQGERAVAQAGRLATLPPGPPGGGPIISLIAAPGPGQGAGAHPCAWTVKTPVAPLDCRAGLDQPVFAAFSWQMMGPGHFRFAAKPARAAGVRFSRFRWRFDDGRVRESPGLQVSHRFGGAPRRWRLVQLEVEARQGKASAVQAVVDRSVPER